MPVLTAERHTINKPARHAGVQWYFRFLPLDAFKSGSQLRTYLIQMRAVGCKVHFDATVKNTRFGEFITQRIDGFGISAEHRRARAVAGRNGQRRTIWNDS